MIKKLQRRFIRIALVALTVAMVLVVGIVNAANWISVRGELAETIAFLSENEAVPRDDICRRMIGRNRHARNLVGESRWFSVSWDSSGTQRNVNLMNIPELDEQTATDLAAQAISRSDARTE